MSLDALSALPLDAMKPAVAAPMAMGASMLKSGADETQVRARIDKTAHDFEASYLSVMFGQMFEGVSTSPPFGGGESESAFRSFLNDAMAKSMTERGGVGLAAPVRKEMLKLQGLT